MWLFSLCQHENELMNCLEIDSLKAFFLKTKYFDRKFDLFKKKQTKQYFELFLISNIEDDS